MHSLHSSSMQARERAKAALCTCRRHRCSQLRQLDLPLRPDMPLNPLLTVEKLGQLGRLSLMSQGNISQVGD